MIGIADDVVGFCCRSFSVDEKEVRGKTRYRLPLNARHVCWWLLVNAFDYKPYAVAKEFGVDHSTVGYALKSIENKMTRGEVNIPPSALDFIDETKKSAKLLLDKLHQRATPAIDPSRFDFLGPLEKAMKEQFERDPAVFYGKLAAVFLPKKPAPTILNQTGGPPT